MCNENKSSKPELSRDDQIKLVEYQATQQAWFYFGDYIWKVGSVVVAGVFVFWGFLLGIEPTDSADELPGILIACGAIILFLLIWFLYTLRNNLISQHKQLRMWELEAELGMKQHLALFIRNELENYELIKEEYDYGDLIKTSGYYLNLFTCAILSMGGPVIIILKYNRLNIPALTMAAAVILFIVISSYYYRKKKSEIGSKSKVRIISLLEKNNIIQKTHK